MGKLPDTLHELLEIALHDLELCEQDDRYHVEMSIWHAPLAGGVCAVCLAGAVLAKTCDIEHGREVVPGGLDWKTSSAIRAINSLRCGDVCLAANYLYGCVGTPNLRSIPEEKAVAAERVYVAFRMKNNLVADYHKNRPLFKTQMRELVTMLRAAGL